MLYLDGAFFSPSSSVLTGNSFEELGGVFVPTAERFDDERLEEDPLGTAIVTDCKENESDCTIVC